MSDQGNWYQRSEPEPELRPPVSPPSADAPSPDPTGLGPAGLDPAGLDPAGPQTQARRFSGAAVGLGALGGVVLTVVFAGVFIVAAGQFSASGEDPRVLLILGAPIPLFIGLAMAMKGGSPQRRGAGLGLVIGWALTMIIGAGACVALIAALSNNGISG